MQSIPQEFDPKGAPKKSDLIRFFQDGLRSSIQAEMESQEEKFQNWNVLIRKATAAEAKTRRQSASQIQEVDQYCLRSHCPSLQSNKHQQEKRQGQSPVKNPHPSYQAQHRINEMRLTGLKGKNFGVTKNSAVVRSRKSRTIRGKI